MFLCANTINKAFYSFTFKTQYKQAYLSSHKQSKKFYNFNISWNGDSKSFKCENQHLNKRIYKMGLGEDYFAILNDDLELLIININTTQMDYQ